MHRYVARDSSGLLVTKGDANLQADTTHVPTADFVGLPRLRTPWIGLPTLWLHQGRESPFGYLALALTMACVLASRPKQAPRDPQGPRRRPRGRHVTGPGQLSLRHARRRMAIW